VQETHITDNGNLKALLLAVGTFVFLVFSVATIFYQPVSSAAPPVVITYQGRLLQNGAAVTTTQDMAFEIYDALLGGNILYTASGTLAATTTVSLTPSSGIFSVNLGDTGTNGITSTIFSDNQNLYLQVVVGGTALSPRRQLTSAPFAMNSYYLMGVTASSSAASQYIPYSDNYGNFTFSGQASSTAIDGGLIYINPTSTDPDETLFGIAVGGAERFKIDANGNVTSTGQFGFSNTPTGTLYFEQSALFSGDASAGAAFVFDTRNLLASSTDNYLFSIRNNGTPFLSVSGNGDLKVDGNIYASSTVIGTPGNPGDLAERVDIAPGEVVEPGDVVVIDPDHSDTYTKSVSSHESAIAGVISTNPIVVVGFGKTENTAVMALTGRVPIKVTTENGAIHRGDLLVSASTAGHAMKYDPNQDDGTRVVGVIGMALDSFDGQSGKIMGLVRTGWVNNRNQTIASLQQDLVEIAEAQGTGYSGSSSELDVQQLLNGTIANINENLNLNGHYLLNVAGIYGKNNAWQIDEQGRFITKVATAGGTKPLYAIQSEKTELILSGSAQLVNGVAIVSFDENIQGIIDSGKPIKVSVTLNGPANGVYVSEKNSQGFIVEELQEGESNVWFDWVVIASRRDGPVQEVQLEEVIEETDTQQDVLDETDPIQEDGANENEIMEEEVTVPEEESIVVPAEPVEDATPEEIIPEVPVDDVVTPAEEQPVEDPQP